MSGDVMEFPRTPEEFCEQYSFFDKDEVYTNGSLLIPVFRVEQMVEHYFERTCHNKARYGNFKCDVCNAFLQLADFDEEPMLTVDGAGYVPDYCPHCGAKVVD